MPRRDRSRRESVIAVTSGAYRRARNRDNRKTGRVFLASHRAALGRLRDLPILTLRLPFSIAFFRERRRARARVSRQLTNITCLPAGLTKRPDESDTEINAPNYAARRVTVGGAVKDLKFDHDERG